MSTQRTLHYFLVLSLAVHVSACSSDDDSGTQGLRNGAGVADDGESCYGTQAVAEAESPYYYRFEYDEDSRILATHTVDARESDAEVTGSLFYRLDAEGRLVTYAGEEFRHDFELDEHGNLVRFVFVYEDWTDLTQPATASPYMVDTYEHTYDDQGRLQQTSFVGAINDVHSITEYSHDSEGRCQTEKTTFDGSAEPSQPATLTTYSYADGKLASKITESTSEGTESWPERVVVEYRYDSEGRLVSIEQDGGGHWGESADGQPDLFQSWTFNDDGSWVYESRDYTTDVPNETIEVDGVEQLCYRAVITYSAGCAGFKARLPEPPAGLECRSSSQRQRPL